MSNRTPSFALAGLLLTLGLACGGGSNPAPKATTSGPAASTATGLTYTDPTGTGWRLVKDATSSSSRLVLNLVGPAGTLTRGVGFNLKASAGVKFDAFSNGLPLEDAGVYQLLSGAMDPNEPVAMTGGVKPGNILSAGIYQKGRDQGAQDSGAALCRIAIILDPNAKPSAGAALTLTVLKAKAIPEDIGTINDDAWTLDRKLRMTDLTVAVGTLTAQ